MRATTGWPARRVYVTIEPCQMCVGAMVHARVARVVYGAREPKAGAIDSAMRAHEHPSLNHRLVAPGGVLEGRSAGRRSRSSSPARPGAVRARM